MCVSIYKECEYSKDWWWCVGKFGKTNCWGYLKMLRHWMHNNLYSYAYVACNQHIKPTRYYKSPWHFLKPRLTWTCRNCEGKRDEKIPWCITPTKWIWAIEHKIALRIQCGWERKELYRKNKQTNQLYPTSTGDTPGQYSNLFQLNRIWLLPCSSKSPQSPLIGQVSYLSKTNYGISADKGYSSPLPYVSPQICTIKCIIGPKMIEQCAKNPFMATYLNI